jgi:hypothetical protein
LPQRPGYINVLITALLFEKISTVAHEIVPEPHEPFFLGLSFSPVEEPKEGMFENED